LEWLEARTLVGQAKLLPLEAVPELAAPLLGDLDRRLDRPRRKQGTTMGSGPLEADPMPATAASTADAAAATKATSTSTPTSAAAAAALVPTPDLDVLLRGDLAYSLLLPLPPLPSSRDPATEPTAEPVEPVEPAAVSWPVELVAMPAVRLLPLRQLDRTLRRAFPAVGPRMLQWAPKPEPCGEGQIARQGARPGDVPAADVPAADAAVALRGGGHAYCIAQVRYHFACGGEGDSEG
jgi:hypothetical protein